METSNEQEEEEEEGGIFVNTQQSLKNWEKIQFSPLLLASSSSNHRPQAHSQAQAHSRAPWEMVVNVVDDIDDCFIFPPSNHEGLHIVAEEQHHDDDVTLSAALPEAEPLSSVYAEVEQPSQEQPLDLRFRDAGEILLKRLGLGFEFLWSKLIHIGALFRSYCSINNSGRRGVDWFPSAVGLLLLPLLYWWQRRRRRARQEKKEHLILLIQRTDEKMSLLLDQITHINEVLSTRHKIPILKSS